jgi:hypothetical protein
MEKLVTEHNIFSSGGVYWPDAVSDPEGAALAKIASDHRMIWLDFKGIK